MSLASTRMSLSALRRACQVGPVGLGAVRANFTPIATASRRPLQTNSSRNLHSSLHLRSSGSSDSGDGVQIGGGSTTGHGQFPMDADLFHGTDFLSKENVMRRVLLVLSEVDKIDPDKIELHSSFRSLGLDSLDEVELVIMLEEEFVIDIQDEVASNILTVADAINYIAQHPFALNDEAHH